jgi:hypothetical protein
MKSSRAIATSTPFRSTLPLRLMLALRPVFKPRHSLPVR